VAAGTAATTVTFPHFGTTLVFVPFIFTMHGHWSARKAHAEYQEHQEMVAAEISRLKAPPRHACRVRQPVVNLMLIG
jgi:hypothetical protein